MRRRRSRGRGYPARWVRVACEILEYRTFLSTYYISTAGSDLAAGTLSAPFRNIQKAASLARAGDTVLVRGGTYRETITPAQSGTSAAPILFKPYNNESVTISGADVLSGWSVSSGSIYKRAQSWDLGAGKNQLFVDGKMMNEARWPNTSLDISHPAKATVDSATSTTTLATIIDSALTQPAGFWNGATIHIAPGQSWVQQSGTVTSYSPGKLTFSYIRMSENEIPTTGDTYYLSGKPAALDAAGEFYRNAADGTLSLRTPASDNPASHSVEAKRRQYAFDLRGRSYIDVQGFKLFASTVTSDAASARVRLSNLDATYLSHYSNLPTGWTVPDDGGILLAGPQDEIRNSTLAYSAGYGVMLSGAGALVDNCIIHDVDYAAGDAVAVRAIADGNSVTHNTIYNTGRSGIKISRGTSLRVLYNLIHDVGLQTTDLGGIYTWNTDGRGSEIAFNRIYNAITGGWGGAGILLDQSSTHYVVHHNVISNANSALKMNDVSRDNTIVNNTLVGTTYAVASAFSMDMTGTLFQNNIFRGTVQIGAAATKRNNLSSSIDPQFNNPSVGDFTLKSTSPAINAGLALPPYTDGYLGAAPDMGGFEFGQAAWVAGGAGASATPTPTPAPIPAPIYVNSGGGVYAGAGGITWSGDFGFSGGTAKSASYAVANTTDDPLYWARRYGNFDYSIPTANGLYTLKLYFADPVFSAAGSRTFNVSAEGIPLLSNFDPAANGGAQAALIRSFSLNITDQQLNLSFRGVIENAIVSGIELLPAPSVSATPFPWSQDTPLPLARHESAAASVGGKMYVFGGFYTTSVQATSRVDAFDPVTHTWTRAADMPEALTHSGQAVDGQTIWLVGGFVGDNPGPSTNRVWKYNTAANSWAAGPALPAPRAGGALVLLGRELHYFGGYGAGTAYTAADQNTHFVLSIDAGAAATWRTAAPLLVARNHMAGAELGGKIYAIGGQKGGGQAESTGNQDVVERYDPATNAWTTVAPLPLTRGHISSSVFILNGRIVVSGGVTNGDIPLADVTEYDPASNTWLALPPLPAPRQAGVAVALGNQMVFAGGETGEAASQATTWVGTLANKWEPGPALSVTLGETAGGIIGNKLYLIGEGSTSTYAFDLSTRTWTAGLAPRPFVGDHHAAEVVNGKLYLFGGLEGASSGRVQIYNPATNSWSLGADMPFAAGSTATSLINGMVYAAGGLINFQPNVGGSTTNLAARYNPATDTWTNIAPMPKAANHAAAATDGSRFYIFGGRAGIGDVQNGFGTVQIYDPTTNSWKSSDNAGDNLAPLPVGRGGMGKAVFHNGEFYVIGGETLNGSGATAAHTFNRVDIYKPSTNTWRLGAAMPTARHGIFPVLLAGRIYVAGGGVASGESASNLLEIYNPI